MGGPTDGFGYRESGETVVYEGELPFSDLGPDDEGLGVTDVLDVVREWVPTEVEPGSEALYIGAQLWRLATLLEAVVGGLMDDEAE